jgi:hypothetical protein
MNQLHGLRWPLNPWLTIEECPFKERKRELRSSDNASKDGWQTALVFHSHEDKFVNCFS